MFTIVLIEVEVLIIFFVIFVFDHGDVLKCKLIFIFPRSELFKSINHYVMKLFFLLLYLLGLRLRIIFC